MEGYLYKKLDSSSFSKSSREVWNTYWFTLENGRLTYYEEFIPNSSSSDQGEQKISSTDVELRGGEYRRAIGHIEINKRIQIKREYVDAFDVSLPSRLSKSRSKRAKFNLEAEQLEMYHKHAFSILVPEVLNLRNRTAREVLFKEIKWVLSANDMRTMSSKSLLHYTIAHSLFFSLTNVSL